MVAHIYLPANRTRTPGKAIGVWLNNRVAWAEYWGVYVPRPHFSSWIEAVANIDQVLGHP